MWDLQHVTTTKRCPHCATPTVQRTSKTNHASTRYGTGCHLTADCVRGDQKRHAGTARVGIYIVAVYCMPQCAYSCISCRHDGNTDLIPPSLAFWSALLCKSFTVPILWIKWKGKEATLAMFIIFTKFTTVIHDLHIFLQFSSLFSLSQNFSKPSQCYTGPQGRNASAIPGRD